MALLLITGHTNICSIDKNGERPNRNLSYLKFGRVPSVDTHVETTLPKGPGTVITDKTYHNLKTGSNKVGQTNTKVQKKINN